MTETGLGPIVALTRETFVKSLDEDRPPAGSTPHLAALWHAANGDLDAAARTIEGAAGAEAAWVRAHLHRRKGDRRAAESAYGEAGKPWPVDSLENEWNEIAGVALLRS